MSNCFCFPFQHRSTPARKKTLPETHFTPSEKTGLLRDSTYLKAKEGVTKDVLPVKSARKSTNCIFLLSYRENDFFFYQRGRLYNKDKINQVYYSTLAIGISVSVNLCFMLTLANTGKKHITANLKIMTVSLSIGI